MNKNTLVSILITCLVFANFFIYSRVITNSIPDAVYPDYVPENEQEISSSEQDDASDVEGVPYGYIYTTADIKDTYSGDLILVNITHPYVFENTPSAVRTPVIESVYAKKSSSYSVSNMNVTMDTVAIEAFNKMMDDFYAYNSNKKTIIVTQGTRTYEEQQQMLNLKIEQFGENQTIAQQPGFSEHHSGLAMDISTYVGGVMGTFTGENEYSWVFENAHKYGFILRYPQEKEDITGISYESWHFRYVGVPHAQYMYQNSLTLEEYIDILAMYPFESIQLQIATDQANYSVYSVPVVSDGTKVPVPTIDKGEFVLSGDNSGHIIVTVKNASADIQEPSLDIQE